jgi:cytoskeletal protein CcmA (bactofilin family)
MYKMFLVFICIIRIIITFATLNGINKKCNNMGKNTVEEATVLGNVNRICEGTEIKGSVKSSADLRIDGKIEGNVQCEGKIIIGEKGYIKGDVSSKNMEVSGRVDGTISVEGQLAFKSPAVVEGEITVNKLVIEIGAVFNGNCHMSNKETGKTPHKSGANA